MLVLIISFSPVVKLKGARKAAADESTELGERLKKKHAPGLLEFLSCLWYMITHAAPFASMGIQRRFLKE
jgi:hypothetical protein